MSIVKVDTEQFKNHVAKKRSEKTPYTVKDITIEIDEFDDIMWDSKGYCQMQYLVRHAKTMAMVYGEFSDVSINPNSSTIVKYKVVLDENGEEVKGTRGEHPEFYEGWIAAIKRRSIFATHLEFDRPSHKRESRYWMKGFVLGCRHLFRTHVDTDAARQKAPYAIGVLTAYKELKESGLVGFNEKPAEENVSLVDTVYNSGYNEFKKVAHMLWDTEIDDLF